MAMSLLGGNAAQLSKRLFSASRTAVVPWNLFESSRKCCLFAAAVPSIALVKLMITMRSYAEPQVVYHEAPKYLTNLHENLEFVLERMRLEEGPVGLQLLNRNARRPKKVGASVSADAGYNADP